MLLVNLLSTQTQYIVSEEWKWLEIIIVYENFFQDQSAFSVQNTKKEVLIYNHYKANLGSVRSECSSFTVQ